MYTRTNLSSGVCGKLFDAVLDRGDHTGDHAAGDGHIAHINNEEVHGWLRRAHLHTLYLYVMFLLLTM